MFPPHENGKLERSPRTEGVSRVRGQGNPSTRNIKERRRPKVRNLPEGVMLRRSTHAVRLEMPITREQGDVVATARLFFSAHEPIAIDVRVCALDGVPVLERAVLRADLATGLRREVWCASARIRPVGRNEVAFEFLEPGSRVQMDISRVAVEQFLGATEEIVLPTQEDDALQASVDRVLRMTGVAADMG